MTITKKGEQIYPINPGDKPPDNWWVCTFLPEHQAVSVKNLGVLASIRFHKAGMIDDFAAEPKIMKDERIEVIDGKVVFKWPAKNYPLEFNY